MEEVYASMVVSSGANKQVGFPLPTGLQQDCLHGLCTARTFVLVFPLSCFSSRMRRNKLAFIQFRYSQPSQPVLLLLFVTYLDTVTVILSSCMLAVTQITSHAEMAVPFSNSRMRIPHGFQSLLEGMAKEVLMVQPPDIYTFSATYFENLLKKRDGRSFVFIYIVVLKL